MKLPCHLGAAMELLLIFLKLLSGAKMPKWEYVGNGGRSAILKGAGKVLD